MLLEEHAPTDLVTRRPGTVERAFQVAASGECRTIEEIERQLHREAFERVPDHLSGTLIRTQLRRILANTRQNEKAQTLQPS